MAAERCITIAEFAARKSVSRRTVDRWIDAGIITAYQPQGPGTAKRIPERRAEREWERCLWSRVTEARQERERILARGWVR